MSGRGAGGAGAGAGDNDGFGDDDIQFDDLDFTDSFAASGDAEGAGAAFTDDVSRMKVALLNEKVSCHRVHSMGQYSSSVICAWFALCTPGVARVASLRRGFAGGPHEANQSTGTSIANAALAQQRSLAG